ncbi:MAG: Crp/Fnr family transcriptional regulator [Gammaproteobacteria bacterium]
MYDIGGAVTGEIAQVGREGVIDASSLLGAIEAPNRAVAQCAGSIYRLPIKVFRDEFDRHGELLKTTLYYTQFLISQVAQTALCNRHHTVSQQLCRWLLSATDRMEIHELLVTQEQIAKLLGVRREGITGAAGRLQKLGVIEYGRGRIEILDRPELERLACECYDKMKRELKALQMASRP